MLNRSPHSVHDLECGRLELSAAMATKMNYETGIHIGWLLDGDPGAPPMSADGREYTEAIYAEVQAEKKYFATVQDFNVQLNAQEVLRAICAILVNANRKRNYHLALYRTWKAINELRTEFGEALELYSIEKVLAYVKPVQDMQGVPAHLREEVRRIQQTMPSGRSGVVFSRPKSKRPLKKRRRRRERDSNIFRRLSVSPARGSART
jgi:hypothetical protein